MTQGRLVVAFKQASVISAQQISSSGSRQTGWHGCMLAARSLGHSNTHAHLIVEACRAVIAHLYFGNDKTHTLFFEQSGLLEAHRA